MKPDTFFCNREEFMEVADLVLSDTPENDVKAISRLAHWKCSIANVPAQVVVTHSLLVIRSFHRLDNKIEDGSNGNSIDFNPSPSQYIGEEFRNLAYASAVSRSISLLLEDNEDLRGLSMKALAQSV